MHVYISIYIGNLPYLQYNYYKATRSWQDDAR